MTTHKRIQWPDVLKAFAIILVVIGHIVSKYDPAGYAAPLAQWIYSFHLPLFMMLSGMFFKYALDKPFKGMFLTRCRTLLLPLLTWSIILLIFQLSVSVPINEFPSGVLAWLKAGGPLRGYWYLKCLFLYIVVCYIAVKVFKRKSIAAAVTVAFFILLPNVNFTRMMICFFWLGYFYNTISKHLSEHRGRYILCISICMAFCYILGWQKFTYLSAGNNIVSYLKFLAMGSSASMFWILLANILFRHPSESKSVKFIAWIGTVSLGIYCIHPLFYDAQIYDRFMISLNGGNIGIYLLWSFIAIANCLILIWLIQKSRVLSFLLLGKKWKNKNVITVHTNR